MPRGPGPDDAFAALLRAIVAGDAALAARLLDASPDLARTRVLKGATRQDAKPHYLAGIGHYLYAGDTALHVAAAAYRHITARDLLAKGADVRARNRRGAEPLHYASDGIPASSNWDPVAQAATIARLLAARADPNCADNSGVMPLHRAVRTRCAAAVRALLDGGADANARNGRGTRPLALANRNTGRGGSGAPEAKAQQAAIVRLLQDRGALPD